MESRRVQVRQRGRVGSIAHRPVEPKCRDSARARGQHRRHITELLVPSFVITTFQKRLDHELSHLQTSLTLLQLTNVSVSLALLLPRSVAPSESFSLPRLALNSITFVGYLLILAMLFKLAY